MRNKIASNLFNNGWILATINFQAKFRRHCLLAKICSPLKQAITSSVAIPSGLGYLRVLTYLDLSENDYSGEIPPEIGRLRPTALNFLPTDSLVKSRVNSRLRMQYMIKASWTILIFGQMKSRRRSSFTFIAAVVSSIAGAGFLVYFDLRILLDHSLTDDMIGSGGSGKVYRIPLNCSGGFVAALQYGQTRVVFPLTTQNYLSMSSWKIEVWTVCFIRRGDLLYFSDSVRHIILEWAQRLQIVVGAAKGLCYMHYDGSTQIIHRDIKSSIVLLDFAFKAKIVDFGLGSILEKDGSITQCRIRSDKKVKWAWRDIHEEKSLVDAIDEDIKEQCYLDEITNMFELGIFCTHALPSNRPTMRDVLQILLRCSSHPMSLVKNRHRSGYDVARLLRNSKHEKLLEDDDGGFTSIGNQLSVYNFRRVVKASTGCCRGRVASSCYENMYLFGAHVILIN
ncbi:hypothetical protein M9H77_02024 [Catharanthus roseus]|uniref:Uncharacterized protein n=1 Tax=Catharanthus roseus TaxID=4058 RepID=A0ACC0C791_CATRO|nr:hypothetical protein M9H77_02024 [Catharanthus roseus]